MRLIGIVYSVNDPAGAGAAARLVRLGFRRAECRAVECWSRPGVTVAGFDKDVIEFDFLDDAMPEAEYFIVLSRHSSQAGVKSYTVHHTGNFGGEALYGGRPGELGIANPAVAFGLLRELVKRAGAMGRLDEYRVSYEATHHGPTSLKKPLTFVEIGSSQTEWADEVNHEILAESVAGLLESGPAECRPAIGIGGGHYPWKHTEYSLREKVCFGHLLPKYAIEYLSAEVLEQMIGRTYGSVELIVVEKKSTRLEHRVMIESFADSKGLEVVYI
ncbi:D-aminoacyl-tRNA deacylase [Thermogladius sp. KZ2Tp1]|uniref:D-aminoacyl-tRNA deacylase n=1 Tax=Thermogladius sp. KZ2Tp1 TaxID=3136289 RepID=UPI003DA9AEFC